MKRVILSSTDMLKRINDAKRELATYPAENVEYVKQCRDEILKAISDQYVDELENDKEVRNINLNAIKTDYMLGAIEDDMMTEEEFEKIYDLLDVIAFEMSAPYT